MSNGTGGGGGKGGVTGGAKKVLGFAVAIFVLMAIAPNIDSLMASAESMGSAVGGLLSAVGNLANSIATAFQSAGA